MIIRWAEITEQMHRILPDEVVLDSFSLLYAANCTWVQIVLQSLFIELERLCRLFLICASAQGETFSVFNKDNFITSVTWKRETSSEYTELHPVFFNGKHVII